MRLHILALVGFPLLLSSSTRADVDVEGRFLYEEKGWGYSGWNGNDPARNIRMADVLIMNSSGGVLASGATNEFGSFSISTPTPAMGQQEIFIRVVADTSLTAGFQRIRVLDGSGAVYGSTAPGSFFIDNSMTSIDVGLITIPKITLSGGEEGNPFNILDSGVRSFEYLTGACGRSISPFQLRLRWPFNGSSATFQDARIDFDDGYDDCVILHEIGHVVHNLYSDSDSPGGPHSFGDSNQDPRLSLGEGFASFWGGAVFNSETGRTPLYMDLNSTVQTGGIQLRLRLEETDPYANDSRGAADEVSVACTLYDLVDTENSSDLSPGVDDEAFVGSTLINGKTVHDAWFEMFEGPAAVAPNVTLNEFWNGWFSVHGTGGMVPEMQALFGLHRVRFNNDSEEPNNSFAAALPRAVDNQWSGSRTIYSGMGSALAPGFGDEDWYSLSLVIGSEITIETRYPNNAADADTQCDTQLSLWNPSAQLVASNQDGGTGRNSMIANFTVTETGDWRTRVRSTHSYRRYGAYNYRARYNFQNLIPVVTSGPSATPPHVTDRRNTTTLTVTVTDAEPLTYEWTPLDGGSIVGSGATVTFVAPAGAGPALFRVEVVMTDSLGAVTQPFTVEIPRVSKEGARRL